MNMSAIRLRSVVSAGAMLVLTGAAVAQPVAIGERPGWKIAKTAHSYAELNRRLEDAIKSNKMGLVTSASASEGAKAQGFTIPGNRVVGVSRNDFARRMLAASLAAGIEAPIRLYVTENADGTGTLSYKAPSTVFAPYLTGANADLAKVAAELDDIFARIAAEAGK